MILRIWLYVGIAVRKPPLDKYLVSDPSPCHRESGSAASRREIKSGIRKWSPYNNGPTNLPYIHSLVERGGYLNIALKKMLQSEFENIGVDQLVRSLEGLKNFALIKTFQDYHVSWRPACLSQNAWIPWSIYDPGLGIMTLMPVTSKAKLYLFLRVSRRNEK